MPIYVYVCRECKGEIEEIQKMDDPPPAKCPQCGRRDTMQRQLSLSNFQLVGSGWEKDGYS